LARDERHKKAQQDWWKNNPLKKKEYRRTPKALAQYKVYHAKRIQKLRDYVNSVRNQPCMDCQNMYPICCMEFDHRPGEIKTANVGALISTGSLNRVKNEMKSCDVVCANCHRIRTEERRTKNVKITGS
jgi:hypothetical protein